MRFPRNKERIMSHSSSDLSKIRRELNPAFSYIILERQGSPGTMDDLEDLLRRLGIPILETKIHESTTAGRIFLVVKLDPERAEQISREYVSVSMPENVTCLFYGSLVQNARKGVAGPAQKDPRAQGQQKIKKRRRGMNNAKGVLRIAFVFLGALAMVVGAGTLCRAQDKVVKVGNIIPLSGPSASVGQQGKNAREMAVEEINGAGGIKSLGGAKLVMLYADSESKPEKGVAEAERFINTEKVHVLTGCWNSAVTYPTTAVAERYGIPFIVPVSVADKITEQGFKTVFRIAAKDSWWTRDQFAFLRDMEKEFNAKVEKLAFIYENGDWGKGFAGQWKELAKKGGYKVVLDEPYPSTATDLSPVVQKIKRANPDVLLLVSNAADAILLTNTLAEYKVNLKAVIGSGGGHADPSFLQATGKNARYLFDIVEWETDVNKEGAKEANEKFKSKYGYNLAGESVDAYVAVYVLADALERAGSLDPAKIREALATTNYRKGRGMIVGYDGVEFDKTGQNKHASLVMVQINDIGKGMERITVWPKNARRGGYQPVFPMP
jgi:branched-chain amino acid transport system substrate-binding protein